MKRDLKLYPRDIDYLQDNIPTESVFWFFTNSQFRRCCVCTGPVPRPMGEDTVRIYRGENRSRRKGLPELAWVCCTPECFSIFSLNPLAYEDKPSYWVIYE